MYIYIYISRTLYYSIYALTRLLSIPPITSSYSTYDNTGLCDAADGGTLCDAGD